MSESIIIAFISALSAIGGSLVTALIQRETKRMAWLDKRILRYMVEIRARQAQENIAAKWLVEMNVFNNEITAKKALRKRTFEETGQSISIGPAEVRETF